MPSRASYLAIHPRSLRRLAFGLLAALPAQAGEREASLDAALYYEPPSMSALQVSTASRQLEDYSRAPGTVLVVTKGQIWERGYRSLAELLADLPSVDVQNLSDGTTNNRIALRGVVGNNKLLILQDGIRISSPTGDPIAVMDNFPLYHVKQVEVVYGPASALYGADAFTGVVNLITDTDPTRGSEIALEGGSFNHRYGHFNLVRALGETAQLQLGGHWREDDNADLSKAYPALFSGIRTGDRFEQPSASHSLNARLDWGGDVSFGLNHSRYQARTTLGAKPNMVEYLANADYITLLTTLWAEWRWQAGEHLSGGVTVDWSRHEVDPASKFVNSYTGFEAGYKFSENERWRIEPQFTYQNGAHRLTGGLSLEWLDALPKTANLPHPYNQGGPFYYPGTNDALEIEFFSRRYQNQGAYFQYSHDLNASTLVHLGARYDSNSVYGDSLTPRLGVNLALNQATQLKYLYGEAFLAPSPYFAYENYGSFTGTQNGQGLYTSYYFHVPNPALQPERLRSHELRLNYNPGLDLELTAGLFHLEAEDIIYRATTTPTATNFVPGGTIYYTTHNANFGTLKASGLDLGFDYTIHSAGTKLQLWGNASYTDGTLAGVKATVPPPFVAHTKFNLGLTWTWSNIFQVTPMLRWTSAAQGAADNGRKDTPGGGVVDLYARWMGLADGTELFLRVDNLFDRRWYSVGDGGSGGFANAPQEPRRAWLGAIVSF